MPDKGERDWSDLPPELIHLISKKLSDLSDFVRFRAVCKSWCSSAPLSDPPPQLPWLLEYLHPCTLGEELRFYALSTGATGRIHVEESLRGKKYDGVGCGYLVTYGAWEPESLVLYNPLTNSNFSPPPLSPGVTNQGTYLVWTGTDPILSRDIVILDSAISGWPCWAAYRPGKTEWTFCEGIFNCCCYCNGMLFAGLSEVEIFDATSGKLLCNFPLPKDRYDGPHSRRESYLVELSGVVMMVWWYCGCYPNQNVEESIFHINKLNFEGRNEQPCWIEVNNIGDHVIFLDLANGFSLKTTSGFKGNCIYFLSDSESNQGGAPYRYDIEAGTCERVSCPFEPCIWFVPSLL